MDEEKRSFIERMADRVLRRPSPEEQQQILADFDAAMPVIRAGQERIQQGLDAVEQEKIQENVNAARTWEMIVERIGTVDPTRLAPDIITAEAIAGERLNPQAVFQLVGDAGDQRDRILPLAEQFLDEALGHNPMAKYTAIRAINDLPQGQAQEIARSGTLDGQKPGTVMMAVGKCLADALRSQMTQYGMESGMEAQAKETGQPHPILGNHTARLLRERAPEGPEEDRGRGV